MCDTAGSAAAPAARCRNRRRGSFIWIPPSPVCLFNHLVGAGEECVRHLQAESLGGSEIYRQLVLRRRLYWKVCRLLALEDAIDVTGHAPIKVDDIRSVGHQPAAGDVVAEWIHGGQSMPARQRDSQLAMNDCRRARHYDQPGVWFACECHDCSLDISCVARVDRRQFDTERWRD